MRPNKYPLVDEIVMVCPSNITDLGAYVTLLEYNLEGLILLADLSKSRIRSMNKIIKIGKKFPAIITSINEQTNNIMLSKKVVTVEEAQQCEKNFKLSKYIYDIADFFKRKMEREHNIIVNLEDFYKKFIWCISTDLNNIMVALRTAAKDFSKVYGKWEDSIDVKWRECFCEILSSKFKDNIVIIEAVLEITCESKNGVNIIRDALIAGQKLSTDSCPFKIKIIKPPFYAITIKTDIPQSVINPIMDAINIIKSILDKNNATFKIIKQPEIVIDKEFEPIDSESDDDDD